ncbi:MAG: hypothetical protein QME35_08765 [Thermoanaerobacteraceae bacterium]|nr:hypothetical protein [Thermoanaerobacteraceae bacterium]
MWGQPITAMPMEKALEGGRAMPVMNLKQMKNVIGGVIIESTKLSAIQTGRPLGVSGRNPFEKSSKYRVILFYH